MRYVVAALLVLAAHFTLSTLVPAATGKGWFAWPWGAESVPVISALNTTFIKDTFRPIIAITAALGFIAAVLALFGLWVPAQWWKFLVIGAAALGIVLFVIYFSPNAVLPLILFAGLIAGVLTLGWTVSSLRG